MPEPELKSVRGTKRSHSIIEDNDPTGYKSGKAKRTKSALGIKAVPFPRYSPDLNPLDFSLWDAVEARVLKNTPKRVETVKEYKARMRKTALNLPRDIVTSALRSIPRRIQGMLDAKGGNIKGD